MTKEEARKQLLRKVEDQLDGAIASAKVAKTMLKHGNLERAAKLAGGASDAASVARVISTFVDEMSK